MNRNNPAVGVIRSGDTDYAHPDYLTPARMAAYGCQFAEIKRVGPRTLLEVGFGNGLLAGQLRKQGGLELTTLDLDPALNPDILGSVTDIPCPDNSFEVAACFQVLEHLPFDQFAIALAQLRRVARRAVLLSLPDMGRNIRFFAHIPGLGVQKLLWTIPLFPRRRPHAEDHCWEINLRGYPLRRILGVIEQSGLHLTRTWRLWEYPYHRFFVLEK